MNDSTVSGPGSPLDLSTLPLFLPPEVLAELPIAAADKPLEWLLALIILVLVMQRRRD